MAYNLFPLRLVDNSNQLTAGLIPTKLSSLASFKELALCKFPAIFSSELDTRKLFASFLQFISSTELL
jgi:hypothetical protein